MIKITLQNETLKLPEGLDAMLSSLLKSFSFKYEREDFVTEALLEHLEKYNYRQQLEKALKNEKT